LHAIKWLVCDKYLQPWVAAYAPRLSPYNFLGNISVANSPTLRIDGDAERMDAATYGINQRLARGAG